MFKRIYGRPSMFAHIYIHVKNSKIKVFKFSEIEKYANWFHRCSDTFGKKLCFFF